MSKKKKSFARIFQKAVARLGKIQRQKRKRELKARIKQIKLQKKQRIIRGRNIFIEKVNIKENVFIKKR